VTSANPLLQMTQIVKTYEGIIALDHVDFRVGHGEIVALIGDNGAGKSTLTKVLAGALRPDSGEITLRGTSCRFRSTRDAIAAGIETIYQGAALVENLSVARNLFLGREPVTSSLGLLPKLDSRYMRSEARTLLKKMGLEKDINPGDRITGLSGGERQAIAIARAMFFQADLIVLDEPTNNLGVEETRRVLDFIRETRDAGRSSIFITHTMAHALKVADRLVVMRLGHIAADLSAEDTTIEELEDLITG
jgi:simple sugar transport system ATP-binding protein